MHVIFTQTCSISVGNLTVRKFLEGHSYELDGAALASALADGRCIPAPEKPKPQETKQVVPVEETKLSRKKPSKKA